ncbi:MAG: HlyD family efflux transporter periplasmic adaptor subunit [Acidobacteria bacterium]|nr:HlyD family efflux transporter periplasmic adaptor subunit [Acidobacteriota bacterium]
MNSRRLIQRFLGLGLVASMLLAACAGTGAGNGAEVDPGVTPQPTPVDVVYSPDGANAAIIAEGRLVPLRSIELSFSASGNAAEVLVKEGDTVRANQVVARLGNAEALQAAMTQANLDLVNAQLTLSNLYANAAVFRAQSQSALATAQDELRTAKGKLNAVKFPSKLGAEEALAQAQLKYDTTQNDLVVAQAGEQAQAVYRAQANVDASFTLYQDAQARYDACGGCNAKERADKLAAYQSAQGDLIVAQKALDTAIKEATAAAAEAEDNLNQAKLNLEALDYPPDPVVVAILEADVALKQANLDSAQAAYDKVKDGPNPDALMVAQAGVDNAQASLTAAKAALARLELKAPFAATIADLNLVAGQSVLPGQSVMVLADFSGWLVETSDIVEQDLPHISLEQPVTIAFEALPGMTVPGHVAFISPFPEETREGKINFTLQIAVDKDQAPGGLQWGMTTLVTFEE